MGITNHLLSGMILQVVGFHPSEKYANVKLDSSSPNKYGVKIPKK